MINTRHTSQSPIPFTVLEQITRYSDWEFGRWPSHTYEGFDRLIYLDLHTGVTNWLDEIKERTKYTETTCVQGTLMFQKINKNIHPLNPVYYERFFPPEMKYWTIFSAYFL
jgi:hypothetical protein